MMSLYSQYIAERTSFSLIEKPHGFLTYELNGDTCFVADIFVIKESRKSGLAMEMCEEMAVIAREFRCKHIVGHVDTTSKTATDSLKFLLAVGMNVLKIEGNFLYLIRKL